MRRLILLFSACSALVLTGCIHPVPKPPTPSHHLNVEVLGVPDGAQLLGALYPDNAQEAPLSARVEGDMVWFDVPATYTGGALINVAAADRLKQFRPTVVGQPVDLTYAGPLDAVRLVYPRPTRAQVLNIRMNFIGPKDSQGRVMFSPFFASLPRDQQLEWEATWRAQGLTHLLLSMEYDYPGSPIPGGDFRTHLADFIALGHTVLDDGFVPVLYLTDGHCAPEDDMANVWPQIFAGFKDVEEDIWYVPGFEVVGPGGCWSSRELSNALIRVHAGAPAAALGVHLQPERATGSSYPVEADDPWGGDESAFWKSNGGQYADALLYQTPHGSKLLATSEADGPDWWGDRFKEILERLGVGGLGWRQVPISAFETVGYDYYHGGATDADTKRIATDAQTLCARYGVTCTFGNGTP